MKDRYRIYVLLIVGLLTYKIHYNKSQIPTSATSATSVDSLYRVIERRNIMYEELKREMDIKEDSIKTINDKIDSVENVINVKKVKINRIKDEKIENVANVDTLNIVEQFRYLSERYGYGIEY